VAFISESIDSYTSWLKLSLLITPPDIADATLE
jgi:hypothetical protein